MASKQQQALCLKKSRETRSNLEHISKHTDSDRMKVEESRCCMCIVIFFNIADDYWYLDCATKLHHTVCYNSYLFYFIHGDDPYNIFLFERIINVLTFSY